MEYELLKKVRRTVALIQAFGARMTQLGKQVVSTQDATEVLRGRLDAADSDAADTKADVKALQEAVGHNTANLSALTDVVDSYGDPVLVGVPAMAYRLGKIPLVSLNGIVNSVDELRGRESVQGTTNYYFVRDEKAVYWVDGVEPFGPWHSISTIGMAAIMITDALFVCGNHVYSFDGERLNRVVTTAEFDGALLAVSPHITARSGFIKLFLGQTKADGTIDDESAYVNLPAATDSLAGLMTNAQNKVVNSLPANIIGNITPYHGESAVDINGWGSAKSADGYSASKQIATVRIKGATADAAGVMTPAQVNKLGLLDKVLLELTGIADERSLEIYAGWDPEATSMREMFKNDKTIVYFPKVDTSKVTDAYGAFESSSLKEIAPIDTSALKIADFMFNRCSNLKTIPQLDFSNCTSAMCVFECSNIEELPALDFSNCTTTGWGLCGGCTKLRKVGRLDFSKCARLENLFSGCSALEELVPFVEPKVPWNGKSLFTDCAKLPTAPVIDLSLCTRLEHAYQGLVLIDRIGELSTGNCTNFHCAFRLNPRLERIESVDVAKATVLQGTFQEDAALTYLKLLNFGTCSTIGVYETFIGVTAWGSGSEESRQSLVDSLLTYSFDRAAAGFAALALQLEPEVLARLTDEEIAAITAKGFTLTSY